MAFLSGDHSSYRLTVDAANPVQTLKAEEADELFPKLDTTCSGTISKEEFLSKEGCEFLGTAFKYIASGGLPPTPSDDWVAGTSTRRRSQVFADAVDKQQARRRSVEEFESKAGMSEFQFSRSGSGTVKARVGSGRRNRRSGESNRRAPSRKSLSASPMSRSLSANDAGALDEDETYVGSTPFITEAERLHLSQVSLDHALTSTKFNTLEKDKIRQMHMIFDLCDEDGSGSIGIEEFRHIITDSSITGVDMISEEHASDGIIEKMFEEFDTDSTGALDFPKFLSAFAGATTDGGAAAGVAFKHAHHVALLTETADQTLQIQKMQTDHHRELEVARIQAAEFEEQLNQSMEIQEDEAKTATLAIKELRRKLDLSEERNDASMAQIETLEDEMESLKTTNTMLRGRRASFIEPPRPATPQTPPPTNVGHEQKIQEHLETIRSLQGSVDGYEEMIDKMAQDLNDLQDENNRLEEENAGLGAALAHQHNEQALVVPDAGPDLKPLQQMLEHASAELAAEKAMVSQMSAQIAALKAATTRSSRFLGTAHNLVGGLEAAANALLRDPTVEDHDNTQPSNEAADAVDKAALLSAFAHFKAKRVPQGGGSAFAAVVNEASFVAEADAADLTAMESAFAHFKSKSTPQREGGNVFAAVVNEASFVATADAADKAALASAFAHFKAKGQPAAAGNAFTAVVNEASFVAEADAADTAALESAFAHFKAKRIPAAGSAFTSVVHEATFVAEADAAYITPSSSRPASPTSPGTLKEQLRRRASFSKSPLRPGSGPAEETSVEGVIENIRLAEKNLIGKLEAMRTKLQASNSELSKLTAKLVAVQAKYNALSVSNADLQAAALQLRASEKNLLEQLQAEANMKSRLNVDNDAFVSVALHTNPTQSMTSRSKFGLALASSFITRFVLSFTLLSLSYSPIVIIFCSALFWGCCRPNLLQTCSRRKRRWCNSVFESTSLNQQPQPQQSKPIKQMQPEWLNWNAR
jgi:Ca2+-binding EF-hand superfamily protein